MPFSISFESMLRRDALRDWRRNAHHDLQKPFTLEDIDVTCLPSPKNEIIYEYVQTELSRCHSAREQIARLYENFQYSTTPLSMREMSLIFGRCKSSIWTTIDKWRKNQDTIPLCHRPSLLSDTECSQKVIKWRQSSLYMGNRRGF